MTAPVRYPSGVSTAAKTDILGDLPFPDPTAVYGFFDDFGAFTAADWTITTTEAGSGNATEATAAGSGGLLVITNDDADNDADFLQWKTEFFKFASGKKAWFKARFKVSDATQSDVVIGLQITDTTPLTVTDGVYFRKDDGDANIDLVVVKDSTATTASAIATMADDTFVTLGFFYDGKSTIHYSVDGVIKGQSVTTNLPDDEELTVSFGVQNGEAAAKVLTVDYILAVRER